LMRCLQQGIFRFRRQAGANPSCLRDSTALLPARSLLARSSNGAEEARNSAEPPLTRPRQRRSTHSLYGAEVPLDHSSCCSSLSMTSASSSRPRSASSIARVPRAPGAPSASAWRSKMTLRERRPGKRQVFLHEIALGVRQSRRWPQGPLQEYNRRVLVTEVSWCRRPGLPTLPRSRDPSRVARRSSSIAAR